MAVGTVQPRARLGRVRAALGTLGPGFVAGASDNDPTTVATVAVIGSTTMFALGWLALLTFPMLAVVQAVAARVGTVTRTSLPALVRGRYGRGWSVAFLASVLPVTLLTLAADLNAGAGALSVLTGLDLRWFVLPIAVLVLALPWLGSYERVRQVLQVIALSLLAYGVAAVAAHPNWSAVLHGTFVPSLHLSGPYVKGALALLGTTLTSYVYVWETIELSQERCPEPPRRAAADAIVGAFFVVVVFWFILVATGATLGARHEEVQTAQQAASALRPAAGAAAADLFAIALLASALLVLPVLSVSSAHMLGAHRRWRGGLSDPPRRARAFYATIAASLTLGAAVCFAGVPPIELLFIASIAGGIGTPVSLVFLLAVARDRPSMGARRISPRLLLAGATVAVIVTAFGLLALVGG